jgi:hypothetical protein
MTPQLLTLNADPVREQLERTRRAGERLAILSEQHARATRALARGRLVDGDRLAVLEVELQRARIVFLREELTLRRVLRAAIAPGRS